MRSLRTNASRTLLAAALSLALAPAWAQDPAHHHAPPQPQPSSAHDHALMDHGTHQGAVDHAAMGHGTPSQATPREPIPAITDADRAAAFPQLEHGMHHAPERNSFVLFDRLEAIDLDDGRGEAWEAQAWFGSDIHRLWLRSEGEREHGHTESADLELLYGRSVTPWWDVVAGVKHDFKPGRSRDWAAFGVQGLAPYKFEVSATAYIGEGGATAATVEAEYEVLLTNRLILQPRVEVEAFGKDDPGRGVGSGLSTVETGLRLRYEVTRRFAPYVGVAWERAYGGTADLRRDEGEAVEDTRLVAGVRLWF
ncbi:copper resistance protein B [Lysobacter auxotrophicus]|uniref:Copper resistance protein B n=1 Tax=Lysobacter auxotrophicus TaxID=2992573 RepID=A0ABM8DCS5_9GAMM|nr:copper resistance protein B [Lysobacter auxotrophicus]BDU16390.1 copper resistance protein B [Lysobacter auxotrophicus]